MADDAVNDDAMASGAASASGVTSGAIEPMRSRNPLARIEPQRRMRLLLWAVIAVVVTGAFMTVVSEDLTGGGNPTIVELELARDVGTAQEILDDWGPDGRRAALASLWADYPFLIAYAAALGLGCLIVAQRAHERGWAVASSVGLLLAWGALAAGVLDAIENAFLISEMATGPTVRQVAGARTAATVKFLLVFLTVAYVAVGGVATRFAPGRPAT